MPDAPLSDPLAVVREQLDAAIALQAERETALAQAEQLIVAARTAVVDQRGRVAALRTLLEKLEQPQG